MSRENERWPPARELHCGERKAQLCAPKSSGSEAGSVNAQRLLPVRVIQAEETIGNAMFLSEFR
jgi:hypothetical protein